MSDVKHNVYNMVRQNGGKLADLLVIMTCIGFVLETETLEISVQMSDIDCALINWAMSTLEHGCQILQKHEYSFGH